MNKYKDGDIVRWFFNPTDYITGYAELFAFVETDRSGDSGAADFICVR